MNIYSEEIIDHYKNPQNFGRLEKFSSSSKLHNPFCGDEIEIFTLFESGVLKKASFSGHGCAVSMAGTSIMLENIIGKTKKQLTNFSEKDMLSLLNIEISETRKKCALLGFFVIKDILK